MFHVSLFRFHSMMMSVILFLAVTGIGIVAGADLRSSAIAIANAAHHLSPAASRVLTKQQDTCTADQVEEIFKDVPTECQVSASGLELDLDGLENFEPDAIESFGEIFCRPACGNPVVVFYRRCFGSVGDNLANFFIQLCAQNSNGDRCYSRSVVSDIRGTSISCSVVAFACCQSLEPTITSVGCCINTLNVGGLTDTTGTIKSDCSNIDNVPGNCGGSTIGGAVVPTIGTLLGALDVLVVIMLQTLFL